MANVGEVHEQVSRGIQALQAEPNVHTTLQAVGENPFTPEEPFNVTGIYKDLAVHRDRIAVAAQAVREFMGTNGLMCDHWEIAETLFRETETEHPAVREAVGFVVMAQRDNEKTITHVGVALQALQEAEQARLDYKAALGRFMSSMLSVGQGTKNAAGYIDTAVQSAQAYIDDTGGK